jgi:pimeloyl-ACP methyl ester carboxylesterase
MPVSGIDRYLANQSYVRKVPRMSANSPILIYVPGMKPKPPAEDHRATLWRCLLEGVRRADPAVAEQMTGHEDDFQLIPWAPLFYDEQRDLSIDLPGVERIIKMDGPDECDFEEASHWHKRLAQLAYLLSDAFPVLINLVANPDMKATLKDTQRYFLNHHGVATKIRGMLSEMLLAANQAGRRIILIGHSLGSVIAFDVLWELSRREHIDLNIDRFVTIGSPLGLNFVQHRILSAKERGAERYPDNIRRWDNISSIGEMTALDRVFADDFKAMLQLGLVERIDDHTELLNYFRGPDGLNVHKCYGYLVNEQTGEVIARCWTGQDGDSASKGG